MKEQLAYRYEILEQIGQGGMSIVYRAKRIKDGAIVALKVLKPEMAENKDHVRRFKKEALAVSSFSHPNIVSVYDVGNIGSIHYIEMEYIEGETLKKIIERENLIPVGRSVNIALQICSALKYAHSKMIVHRDIKSQNILVMTDDEIKVTDFGIAKDISASTITFEGTNVMGSVHYFSPEQAKGETVDEKSDIYSLGIVIYEMLMGTVPFKGDTTVAIALKHLQEPILPLNKLNKNIPEVLSRIVLKATQKDPKDRYQSMEALERDLYMFLVSPEETSVMNEPVKEITAEKEASAVSEAALKSRQTPARTLRAKKGRSSKDILKLSFVAILFIGLLVTMVLIGETILTTNNSADKVYVPKFIGKSEAEATDLADKNNLKLDISKETDDTVDEGYVISQKPDPGNTINSGSTVKIVISEGRGNISMPDVTKIPYAEAFIQLDQLGLKIEKKNYQESNEADGTILAQEPEVGTSLKPGDGVSLWISGDEDISLIVPTVKLKKYEDAIDLIKQNSLKVRFIFEEDSNSTPGTVLRTNPGEGIKVERNSTVDFYISKLNKKYVTNRQFQFTVPEDKTDVIITVEMSKETELVVYHQTYVKGAYDITVPVSSDSAGEKNVKLYMNFVLIQQQRITIGGS